MPAAKDKGTSFIEPGEELQTRRAKVEQNDREGGGEQAGEGEQAAEGEQAGADRRAWVSS